MFCPKLELFKLKFVFFIIKADINFSKCSQIRGINHILVFFLILIFVEVRLSISYQTRWLDKFNFEMGDNCNLKCLGN